MNKKQYLPEEKDALPGRGVEMPVLNRHAVHGRPIKDTFLGLETVLFGMGCFWGAERLFWGIPGVVSTAVGYAGGYTLNPRYEEVCSGLTGHAEVVSVFFDPKVIGFESLLSVFWENHDPTQGMRQGNDQGTQYRSCIYCTTPEQYTLAMDSRDHFSVALLARGFDKVTTEIKSTQKFYYAETTHQQYLAKNPTGYCGLQRTGVLCSTGSTIKM